MTRTDGMDLIEHPAHYTVFSVETIELTEHLDFCLGNVVKYVMRAPYKNGGEDVKKARWYLNRAFNSQRRVDKEKFAEAFHRLAWNDGENMADWQLSTLESLYFYIMYGDVYAFRRAESQFNSIIDLYEEVNGSGSDD